MPPMWIGTEVSAGFCVPVRSSHHGRSERTTIPDPADSNTSVCAARGQPLSLATTGCAKAAERPGGSLAVSAVTPTIVIGSTALGPSWSMIPSTTSLISTSAAAERCAPFVARKLLQQVDFRARKPGLANRIESDIVPPLITLHSETGDAVVVDQDIPVKNDVATLARMLLGPDVGSASNYISELKERGLSTGQIDTFRHMACVSAQQCQGKGHGTTMWPFSEFVG
jgi:hypothetical protein